MIYNDQGLLIEDSIYTNKYGYHQLVRRKKYTYYNDGRRKTEKKVNESCPGGYNVLKTYYYNSRGKLVKIYYQNKCYNNHYFDYPIYFKYDTVGNIVEKVSMQRDTSLVFYKNVYQYDVNDNLTSDKYYFHEGDSLELSSIKEYIPWIVTIISLEALCYLISYFKFKKSIATHSILAKLWTLTLLCFLIDLVLNGTSYVPFIICIVLGVFSRIEIILIILKLNKWTTDVPSFLSVSKLNQGIQIKKNKLFNS
jgi:hypothetical protein